MFTKTSLSCAFLTPTILTLTILTLSILFTAPARANIYQFYRGIDDIVDQSDTIAIVRIDNRALYKNAKWIRMPFRYDPQFPTTDGGYDSFFCTPIRILRGTTESLTRAPLNLGFEPATIAETNTTLTPLDQRYANYLKLPRAQRAAGSNGIENNPTPFTSGTLVLVFCKTASASQQPNPQLRNCAVGGSLLILPPQIANAPLSGKTAQRQITNLIKRLLDADEAAHLNLTPMAIPASPTPHPNPASLLKPNIH